MDSVAGSANGGSFEEVKIRAHVGAVVRQMVEETLNSLLWAAGDPLSLLALEMVGDEGGE